MSTDLPDYALLYPPGAEPRFTDFPHRLVLRPAEGGSATSAPVSAALLHAEPPAPVVIQPQSKRYWRQCAEELLLEHPGAVTAWEQEFLQSILGKGYAPSQKQEGILRRIATKCGAPAW